MQNNVFYKKSWRKCTKHSEIYRFMNERIRSAHLRSLYPPKVRFILIKRAARAAQQRALAQNENASHITAAQNAEAGVLQRVNATYNNNDTFSYFSADLQIGKMKVAAVILSFLTLSSCIKYNFCTIKIHRCLILQVKVIVNFYLI